MAKCKKCGKSGFKVTVNEEELCSDCERLSYLEEETQRLNNMIIEQHQTLEEQEAAYRKMRKQAERDALAGAEAELQAILSHHNIVQQGVVEKENRLAGLKEQLNTIEKQLEEKAGTLRTLTMHYQSILQGMERYFSHSLLEDELKDLSALSSEELLGYDILESNLHCMTYGDLRTLYDRNKAAIQAVLDQYMSFCKTKSDAAVYQLIVVGLQAECNNVLAGLSYGKIEDILNETRQVTKKYFSMASALDWDQEITGGLLKLIAELEGLFVKAVQIEYECYCRKQKEAEEQEALQAQKQRDTEEKRELERQRIQVEAEEQKFLHEMEELADQLKRARDPSRIPELKRRQKDLQSVLRQIRDKKARILELQEGKAGYIYILSNIGSLGKDVYQIGMTKRTDPLKRIAELNADSVPFPFDIHSLIFSSDVAALKKEFRKRLVSNRVNRINSRKEFFRISAEELENIVQELQPHAEFRRTAAADQYHRSLTHQE